MAEVVTSLHEIFGRKSAILHGSVKDAFGMKMKMKTPNDVK